MAARKRPESAALTPLHAGASRKTKAIASPATTAPAKSKAKPERATPPKRARLVKVIHQVDDPNAPIDSVQPHPDNANKADQDQLEESIDENGYYGWLIAQKSTGYVLVGNHRWRVLKARGTKTTRISFLDVDDAAALKILATDNGTAEHGKRDPTALEALLLKITGGDASRLKGTGYRGTTTAAEMMERIKAGQKKPEPPTPFDDDDEGEFSGQDEHPDRDPEDRESSKPRQTKDAARHPLPIVLTNAEKRDWDACKALVGKKNDRVCFLALLGVFRRAESQGLLEQLRAEPA